MRHKNRILAFGICTVIFATGLFAWRNSTEASAAAKTTRLSGSTRYETAVAASKNGWTSGSKVAVIVSGSDFPDALSSAPLAKKYNAPILLSEKSGLRSETLSEISRLGVSQVYIVGGTGVVSANVESQLKTKGITNIKRLSGKDRYETSVKVAEEVGTSNGIVVASGSSFADALSIAPIAAQKGMPILLTPKDYVSSYVKSFLTSNKVSKSYIIGGTGVINDQVKAYFPGYERIWGADRYATNINILDKFSSTINFNNLYIASGSNFPDGLVSAPLAALNGGPVILMEETGNYYPKVLDRINGLESKNVYILGGTAIVSDNIVAKIVDAIDTFRVVDIQ